MGKRVVISRPRDAECLYHPFLSHIGTIIELVKWASVSIAFTELLIYRWYKIVGYDRPPVLWFGDDAGSDGDH